MSDEELCERIFQLEKENSELKAITKTYDSMKNNMPDRTPIVIADKKYFNSGCFTENYIPIEKYFLIDKALDITTKMCSDVFYPNGKKYTQEEFKEYIFKLVLKSEEKDG